MRGGLKMDRLERKLRADVKKYGWHVLNVFSDEGGPGWSYSVGLYHTLRHAEIVIIGLPSGIAHQLINDAGSQVREGESFADGTLSTELLQGYSCTFRSVPRSVHESYFGRAIDFYDGQDFPVLQLVYPDREGRWPWEEGVTADFRALQPVLADQGS